MKKGLIKVLWLPAFVIGGSIFFLGFTSWFRVNYNKVLVTEVIDGDTLWLATGKKVRLIGIDTPEMYESEKLYKDARRTRQDVQEIMAGGREAYAFTRNLVEGKVVRLEFDKERHDDYGRLLAYVWYKDDVPVILLNAAIIESGYAVPMAIPPNLKYAVLFDKLYHKARADRLGLWKD